VSARDGTAETLGAAIEAGRVADRVWLYSNYHCNLSCVYCLTESSPRAARRLLPPDDMIAAADEAVVLRYRALGVTGGEPFLTPGMPELLAALAARLPTLVLTNATLFTERLLDRLRPLADLPLTIQISLDSAEPEINDELRGPRNFSKVMQAIPRLVDMGIPVRIATTGDHNTAEEMERLCALHRSLGVDDDDHVVRPIVRRGRAVDGGLGVVADAKDLFPELTLTADGAFWSPFAPTVHEGRLDTDLLLTRQRLPLDASTRALLAVAESNPTGTDTTLNIR
jgi:MoaA/NifB/PqqE/SkfB family radical SAM enzyme